MISGADFSLLEIASLVICFIASGFFSGSEAVLMSLNIDRARQIMEEGGSRSKAMTFMIERPNELLSTILVGNNIVNILAASLTTTMSARYFKSDAVGFSVGLTTIVILIFGEIIPKAFGRNHAEKLSYFVIQALRFIYIMLYPVIKFLVWIIHAVLGNNANLSGRMVTKNDIEYMITRAEEQQSMDSKQLDMLNSILEFPTIKVKDIMVSRTKVKHLKVDTAYDDVIAYLKEDVHSRYPVVDGDLDNTLGVLLVKDLAFISNEEKDNFDLRRYIKEPFVVYEHMKIQAVFDYMNRKKAHLALVKDENGLIVGLVTLEDIVEEILGDIVDEHDDFSDIETAPEEFMAKEGIVVEGSMSLRELYNDYDIKIPLNDNYSTLAGFILDTLGNSFPEEGQIIVWEGYSFELEKVIDYEIKEVRIRDVSGERHIQMKKDDEEEIREKSAIERRLEQSFSAK
ncbi:MAG: hemolysin family protein [Bdellovibrio sp.]